MRRGAAFVAGCSLVFCFASSAVVSAQTVKPSKDYTQNVYTFLGVDWGGNTFVGAALPFGMVKLGPDMESFDGRPSGFGYWTDGQVLGFSHTHLSGAQGKYGNVLLMPVTGPLDIKDIKSPRNEEINHPGFYAAQLTRYGVRAELTTTRRVGLHRYTFTNSGEAHITLSIDHCLSRGLSSEAQRFLGGEVHMVSDHEAEGMGRYTGGWNKGGEYRVYFAMALDTRASGTRTWSGAGLSASTDIKVDTDQPLGASFDFTAQAGQVVQAKVAISFVSVDQARATLAQEAPGWSFDAARSASHDAWNHALAKIDIHGESDSKRIQFYTAMYHTMLMPTDRTGENPNWQSSEPYYDDYYAIWDTYRSSAPLLTLIAPERERDLIRSLIDIYRHIGYMPDARSGNDNGRTQGGSNANVMVADAFAKHLGGIDYETAFEAMLKDASVPPANAQKEGRGGIVDYNSRGYITLADERSGSRTVEYSYDDFTIAEVACGLHRPAEAKQFATRANNWQNLWDKNLSAEGFKGFLRPRKTDGSWAAPDLQVRGTWPDFFYEGDLWTYSFYAPQDVRQLIAMSGGDKTFVRRLDNIFVRGHFDVTNEPGFLMPVLYNWAGRPDHTADVISQLLEKAFTAERSGIPGNDDSGAMSSWFIFNSLGFYPNAGQDVYLIGTPSFPEAELHLANGKTLRIIAKNLDAEHLNHYVQSAMLNGAPLDQSWFRHDQIANGGTLELTMGPAPSVWGTRNPPPSLSDAASPLCAEAASDGPFHSNAPDSEPIIAVQPPGTVKMNQIQVIGTHNSYHAGIAPSEAKLWQQKNPKVYAALEYKHPSLTAQLDGGVRQLELDVFADTKGGRYAHPSGPQQVAAAKLPADPEFDPHGVMSKPGFKLMHVQDVDYRSNCQPFVACLEEVHAWSKAHPRHIPIFLLIETKQRAPKNSTLTTPEPFTAATFDALDTEIRSVFRADEMIVPDDVRGEHDSLEEAVLAGEWPSLDAARGKVILLMDQHDVTPVYLEGHPSLRGRVLFTNSEPGQPDAAFIERNDGPAGEIAELVRMGYLVRTRTDADTKEARANDTRRRDAMIASGAQILSTDYPPSEAAPWDGHFSVALPQNAKVARCDPANSPAACSQTAVDSEGTH
ncbi:MAG TPA: GH92 family glycosyl hydrolase [Acidobacteriaceae bacterium]|nr:GH92 family glycosyl hydrolase [Acidobacteriaceae bacterium]